MTIRVLRVIEYEYATPERMMENMARWTTTATFGTGDNHMVVRSSVVTITPSEAHLLTPDTLQLYEDKYTISKTSCACGGTHAWMKLKYDGAFEMIGCVCHTIIPTPFTVIDNNQ